VAIAVRAVGTVVTATTAAVNAPLPVGWQPNDVHALVIETENEPIPAITGWSNVGTGVQNVATGTVTALTIRYRVAQSGDTAPSVPPATGGAAGKHTIARIIGFSGVDTTTPWDTTLFGSESVSDTTVSFPDITTTTANCMIVHVFSTGQDTTTAQSSGAGTNANLTGGDRDHDHNVDDGELQSLVFRGAARRHSPSRRPSASALQLLRGCQPVIHLVKGGHA
jgi:hypothetical protein